MLSTINVFLVNLDITKTVAATVHEPDAEKKMAARQELATKTLPRMYGYMERLADGKNYLVGDNITVADLMLYCGEGWIR